MHFISTQYLLKWLASFRMAKIVIARGKQKNVGGGQGGLRGGRRDKGKSKRKGGIRNARNDQCRGVDISVPHTMKPYSYRHCLWALRNEDREVRSHTLEDNTFIGDTGRPPGGNVGST